MKQSVTVGAQLLWSGRYGCNNGRYGCTIVMSYIEINKAVSQWLLTFNLCVSVTWPLTCAFHIPCTHTPEIIDMHRGMCDKKVSQIGSWTAGRDGPLGWTFETNGADSLRPLLQKSIRAGRGVGPWPDGPPGWTFETNGTDSWRRLLQKFVRAGRGRTAVTGCWDELLKQTARFPGADCFKSLSDRAVHVNQAAYHVYFPEPHWNSMGLPEITIW